MLDYLDLTDILIWLNSKRFGNARLIRLDWYFTDWIPNVLAMLDQLDLTDTLLIEFQTFWPS